MSEQVRKLVPTGPPSAPESLQPGEGKFSAVEDAVLLSRLRTAGSGEDAGQEIWSEIVRRWGGRLYAFARSMTKDEVLAEDAAHESLVELWKAVAVRGAEIENPKGWLFKLVSRKALSALKAKRRRDMEARAEAERQEATGYGDEAVRSERQEVREVLYRVVDALPEKLRMPVLLHFGSGFTQTEIAEMTGCRQSTVSDRLLEALDKLKQGMLQAGYSSLPAAVPALLGETLTSPPPILIPATLAPASWQLAVKASARASRRGAATLAKKASSAAYTGVALATLVAAAGAAVWYGPGKSAPPEAQAVSALPPASAPAATAAPPVSKPAPEVLPPALPPWQPFSDDFLTYLPKGIGTWKTGKSADGLSLTFVPPAGERAPRAVFAYLGRNFSSSVELTGEIEYLGNREHFQLELGICHPNRVNFTGNAWLPASAGGTLAYHAQVWFDAQGGRISYRVLDKKGKLYVFRGDVDWIPPPWQMEQVEGEGPPNVGNWRKLAGMKACGLAFATVDPVRILNLRIRPLVKEALWPDK